MKKNFHLIVMLCTFMMFFNIIKAQNDSIRDKSYYLDDGGISVPKKNLIKVNVLTIVNGDLPLFYERVLSESISIEIGAGLLLPYYNTEIHDFFSDEPSEIENPDLGYSIWFKPKFYPLQNAPEESYIGVQFIRKNYNQDNQSIIYTDLTLNYGVQFVWGKHFVFDPNVGVGLRFKDQTKKEEMNNFVIPVGINIGVIL